MRVCGGRRDLAVRILLGLFLLLSGPLGTLNAGLKLQLVASSETIPSSRDGDGAGVSSSLVVGEKSEESGGVGTGSVSAESSPDSYYAPDGSSEAGSSVSLPEGASLVQGESTLELLESVSEKFDGSPKQPSPEGAIEYGYSNIPDSSVDARSPGSEPEGPEYSDPAIMESLDQDQRSKIDSSQVSKESLDGSLILDVLNSTYKKLKSEEKFLEADTERVEETGSPLKTPKTHSVSEPSMPEEHAMHVDQRMKSPHKTPDKVEPADYEIKVEAKPYEREESPATGSSVGATEFSGNQVGSEVVFEETSESKLPRFMEKEESKGPHSQGEEAQFSGLTSGISETSEGSLGSLGNVDSSSLMPPGKEAPVQALGQEEGSLNSDISKEADSEFREKSEKLTSNSFGFIDSSPTSAQKEAGRAGGYSESSFVNPNTEDISVEVSRDESPTFVVSAKALIAPRERSESPSITLEPPAPPSSAVEEKTVGSQRIYSGPYVRTSATSGKVSPRIASVINSLMGQFEKLNLYGAGGSPGTGGEERNVSNQFVRSMRDNFDGVKNAPEFVPQNKEEEEWLGSLKSQQPKNTFLFKNRYEEMKGTQNSSGKTLLQEELEKMRGTYANSLSRQFSTGKVWERPSRPQGNQIPAKLVYSGDEFLDRAKEINPNIDDRSREPTEGSGVDDADPREDSKVGNEPSTPQSGPGHESPLYSIPTPLVTPNITPTEGNLEGPLGVGSVGEVTTNGGGSDVGLFSRKLALTQDNFTYDDTTGSGQVSEGRSEVDESEDEPQSEGHGGGVKPGGGLGVTPFSYINAVKELPLGLKTQEIPPAETPVAILDRRAELEDIESRGSGDEIHSRPKNELPEQEVSISYSKDVELSPEQENEISLCYSRARKIKTVNFGLDLSEDPNSVTTEALIYYFIRFKPKIRDLIAFGHEVTRVAEKYSKKRSWRKKTRKFKMEFLELSEEFLQHSRAIRSLVNHLVQVTNKNILNILQQILTEHKHSKQSLLVQCKVLYQAFYSYKDSVRNKLLRKISDLYFVDVLNEQLMIYLEQRFQPLVKAIKSNKYLKKKLSKLIPDVSSLLNSKGYNELSQIGGGEKATPKKKQSKFARFFQRFFKKPSCFRCSKKSKKRSKKQRSDSQ
ncbi:signal-peptide protein [Cryptosporidium felis]|nr:signal-peptide protein [Cryptosporidium felis]